MLYNNIPNSFVRKVISKRAYYNVLLLWKLKEMNVPKGEIKRTAHKLSTEGIKIKSEKFFLSEKYLINLILKVHRLYR